MIWGADFSMKGAWPGLPPQCLLLAPKPSTCQGHRSSQVAAQTGSIPALEHHSALRNQPFSTPAAHREGGEGTFALFRLHRPHTHTQRCPPSSPKTGRAGHSPELPSPIPAAGTARGTDPSLDAQGVPGRASRDVPILPARDVPTFPSRDVPTLPSRDVPTFPALPLRNGMEQEEAGCLDSSDAFS